MNEYHAHETPKMTRLPDPDSLTDPVLHLGIGVTGHRDTHPVYGAHKARIEAVLAELMDRIDQIVSAMQPQVTPRHIAALRVLSLLANGADLLLVKLALARQWQVVAPLPFGAALNVAINADPDDSDTITALMAGTDIADAKVASRAAEIGRFADQAHVFELAEQDHLIEPLFRAHIDTPDDADIARSYMSHTSERAAIAARVMIEQSDLMIGIWDGVTQGAVGGTRHSIATALSLGVPVLWVDARQPENWRLLACPEDLAVPTAAGTVHRDTDLQALITAMLNPVGLDWDGVSGRDRWRPRSNALLQAYRRVETVFGEPPRRWVKQLTQTYEAPDAIGTGSGASLLFAASRLPGVDRGIVDQIGNAVLRPFAWADGVSTYLSDAYRGSMVTSFFLSAFAIIGGIAYMPFVAVAQKWGFALFELLLLSAIVAITYFGRRRHWHGRWFATRRVAEYFRHAPILLLLGVARSAGRWPSGPGAAWPEYYASHALGHIGLPKMVVTSAYLRGALQLMRDQHVMPQRDYHRAKAKRLKRVQHNLDRLSETLFVMAVLSVALYLLIVAGTALLVLPSDLPHDTGKAFTFMGVLFPTLGGAFAGVHYFGDFERFASISEVTAEKLDHVAARTTILLAAPDDQITYPRVSALVHGIDEIVVSEIESWQAVFGGKNITVPV